MKKLNTEKLKNKLLDGFEKTEAFVQKHKTDLVIGAISVLAGTTVYYHEKYQKAYDVGERLATAVDDLGYTPAVQEQFLRNLLVEQKIIAPPESKED